MGYQGYGQWAQPGMVPEDRILEDLEYLQQMYPTYARRYQSAISSVVDKMDYEGSFIYDQYPDKLTIQRMVESVMAIIRTNEEAVPREGTMLENVTALQNKPENSMQNRPMTTIQGISEDPVQYAAESNVTGSNMIDRALTEQAPWHEKEPWIRELVTVLMYYEILMRRRKKNKFNRYYQF